MAVMAASRLLCHICELPTKQSFTLKGGSKYFVPFQEFSNTCKNYFVLSTELMKLNNCLNSLK